MCIELRGPLWPNGLSIYSFPLRGDVMGRPYILKSFTPKSRPVGEPHISGKSAKAPGGGGGGRGGALGAAGGGGGNLSVGGNPWGFQGAWEGWRKNPIENY